MKQIDEAEALHRAAAKAFAEAVETSAKYAVEVNRHEATEFREQVLSLAGRVTNSTAASELDVARSTFRGELRNYAEKAGQQVIRLRDELEAAAAAMRTFAQGVSSSTGEHETVLNQEFRQLEQAAQADDVHTVRAAVHGAIHTVTTSYNSLKQAHALVIAQLRDEIRVLQSELQRGQQKPELPPGVEGKRAFDQDVEDLLRHDRPFMAVLVSVADHRREPYRKFPREKVEAALAEVAASLTTLVRRHAPKAAVAAWSGNVYAVALPAGVNIEEWSQKLTTSHVFQLDGLPRTLPVLPRMEIVKRVPGESPTLFFDRLSKAADAIAGTA